MTNIEKLEQFFKAKSNYDVYFNFQKNVCVFGKILNLDIDLDDNFSEKIDDDQVSQIMDFYLNQDKYFQRAKEEIIKYLHSKPMKSSGYVPSKLPDDIFEYITPKQVYVSKKFENTPSRLGLIFDCEYAPEGICVAFKNGIFDEIREEALLALY